MKSKNKKLVEAIEKIVERKLREEEKYIWDLVPGNPVDEFVGAVNDFRNKAESQGMGYNEFVNLVKTILEEEGIKI